MTGRLPGQAEPLSSITHTDHTPKGPNPMVVHLTRRCKATVALVATGLTVAFASPAMLAYAEDAVSTDAPTSTESVQALRQAAPEVLADAPSTSEQPPAAEQQAVGDVTTKIAADPEAGFAVDTPNSEPLKIKPVGVDASASDTNPVAGGEMAVSTGTDPGVSTIIKREENGISTYTVISGPESPERYTWDVGEGKTITVHDDGHASVQNTAGQDVAHVPAPYAKTSDGTPLQGVRFEADGSRLTLVVPHRSQVTDYGSGVVADPLWLPAIGTVAYFVGRKCGVGISTALWAYFHGPWSPTVRGALGAATAGCILNGFKIWKYI